MPNNNRNSNKQSQNSSRRSLDNMKRRGKLLPLTFIPPKSKMVNFVATYRFAITESAVSSGAYFMLALNNPYDVLTSVGGPSAMGWTSMVSYYNKYRCDTTRVRVEAYASGTANGLCEACLVPMPINSALPSSPENWRDTVNSQCKLTATTSSASGATKIILDRQWNMWDLLGVSKQKYCAEDNFGAVYNGNPVNQVYCAITAYGWGGATAVSLTGKYTVSFSVLLYSPTAQNP